MASFGTTIPVGFTGPNQVAVSAPTNDTVLLDFNSAADGTTIVKSGGRLTVGTAVSGTSPFADGTLAAPSITFASDLGLGFFRIGADIIGGATAGVLGFRYGGASQTSVLGAGAFAARTAGTGGTAVGHGAGDALTNTANVTALGANANGVLTSANGSTSVGSNSQATTDATSLGFGALALGTRSVAIGAGAGGGTGTQGADNVVMGPFAFDGNKTNSPTGVVAIGLNALGGDLTTGACNSTAIGSGALGALTSGSDTVAIGHNAGTFPTTGGFNVFVGTNADSGSASTGVQNCVVLGFNARATASGGVMIGSGVGTGTGVQGADNIAIGRAAFNGNLTNAVTGVVAIGVNALGADLTGVAAVDTVAIGSGALSTVSSSTRNVAIGFNAGDSVTTQGSNVFIGWDADTTADNGNQIAIGAGSRVAGAGAMAIGTSATASDGACVTIGSSAVSANNNSVTIGPTASSSGQGAIVIGNSAGSTGMGINNIAIGIDCLDGAKTNSPTGIVAIGPLAMRGAMTTAACNSVAVGFSALRGLTSGTKHVAVGFEAGLSSASSTGGVYIGNLAGRAATGSSNVFVGNQAGSSTTTGTGNVCVGDGAQTNSTSTSNSVAIGISAIAQGSVSVAISSAASATGALAIAIGQAATASNTRSIAIGDGASAAIASGLAFRSDLATVAPGLAVQFNAGAMGPTTSTIRHKTDVALAIREPDGVNKLNEFDKIRVVTYKSKAEADDNKEYLGLIAEELVGKVHPSLIVRDLAGDPIGVAYDRFVCVLLLEVLALRRRMAALETPLTPMPALPAYTPVSEADLYPDYKLENERLAKQKLDSKADLKRKKAVWAANLIEKAPEKEAEIMATHDNETKTEIRAEQERRAVKAAEEEEAQAKAEAESEVKEE